jgi:hypothetical protein
VLSHDIIPELSELGLSNLKENILGFWSNKLSSRLTVYEDAEIPLSHFTYGNYWGET